MSCLLAVLPPVAVVAGVLPLSNALLLFGSVGWLVVAFYMNRENHIHDAVLATSGTLDLEKLEESLPKLVEQVNLEFRRYHRAVSTFRGDENVNRSDLGANLRRIAQVAYHELHASAVELSLFDEASGLWSQGLVLGAPRTVNSQSMLSAAVQKGKQEIITSDRHTILVMPLVFAGTMFGALRVELPIDTKPSKSDLNVLHVLGTEGAIMLVDARFTDELLKLRKASEESVRAKTGFLANLSHELRGPLGIILNGAELMIDGLCGEITAQQKETLEMIKGSGDHLLDLVNDVLDYAKVEAGKVAAKPVDIPLHDLLSDLVAVVRSQALAKNHSLLLEPVDRTLGMICDKRHARQMLINFLTNAVKYTPDGGKITVSAQRWADGRVRIAVKDSGIGIPESQRDKVFAAFERVDDKYALSQTGTGLGMPLTRRLAEVNGGGVEFDSKVGEGSTFYLIMPAVDMATEQVEENDGELATPLRAQGQGESILLVDNDTASRQMIGQYLSSQGFEIVLAQEGSEVIRILRDRSIELAVVENDMPNLPGEEMVSVIRSNPHSATVPIILLSAKAFVFDIERFLKLGVDRCLSKPVALSELATTARRLIDETKTLQH